MTVLSKIPSTHGMFTVKANPAKNNQIFVAVFLNADKHPIFGTIFSAKENPAAIIEWAAGEAKRYPKSIQF